MDKNNVIRKLNELGIAYEYVTFSLSSNMKHYRDWEWEYILRKRQILDVEKVGSKLQLIALNGDEVRTEVGKVSVFNREISYTKGIVLDLEVKELDYSNGDKRNCLDFEQTVLLIGNISELPKEFTKAKDIFPLWLRGMTKKEIRKQSNYTNLMIVIIIIVILYLILK